MRHKTAEELTKTLIEFVLWVLYKIVQTNLKSSEVRFLHDSNRGKGIKATGRGNDFMSPGKDLPKDHNCLTFQNRVQNKLSIVCGGMWGGIPNLTLKFFIYSVITNFKRTKC